MSLLNRALVLVWILTALWGGWGHWSARRAAQGRLGAEQRLGASLQAQAEVRAALETSHQALESLRRERQAQEAALARADHHGGQLRREGEARALALLQAHAPEDLQALMRWGRAEAQTLVQRLEMK